MKRFSLKPYKDKNSPAVFYSLWGLRNLAKHKAMAVIVWRGTDIIKIRHKLERIKKRKDTYHIAISSFIMEDLNREGIPYKFIPIVGADVTIFKPEPLGNEIYTYIPSLYDPKSSGKYRVRYNYKLVKKIKRECGFKVNISTGTEQYSRKQLKNIYRRCFCGLRLTSHDGLPNQVIEMGLMGRKNFYNGNIPGSIKWDQKDERTLMKNIEKESKNIGKINAELSEQIKKFINVGEDWLDTKFWRK